MKDFKVKNSIRNKNDLCEKLVREYSNCSQPCISNDCIDEHNTFFMIFCNGSVMQRTVSSNNFQNGGEGEHQLIPSVTFCSVNEFFQH